MSKKRKRDEFEEKKQEVQVAYLSICWNMSGEHDNLDSALARRSLLHDWLVLHCRDWIYQLERGLKSGIYHYQGFCRLKTKDRPKALAIASNHHGLNGMCISAAHDIEALKWYCMKTDDTKIAGPWTCRPKYEGKDIFPLKDWQLQILMYCQGPVNTRELLWIFDQIGKHGKTNFKKFMSFYHDAKTFGWMKAADIFNLMVNEGPGKIYIFDLTREKPQDFPLNDLYAAIEAIKDGSITNGKFNGGKMMFDPPHVIVLANFKPLTASLSADRWTIIDLVDEPEFVNPNKEKPFVFIPFPKRQKISEILEPIESKKVIYTL